MRTQTVKKSLYAVLILGLVAAGGYWGYRGYMALRQRHLLNQARQYLVASNPNAAVLCLRRALGHNPEDVNACRLMADMAEASQAPSALRWRSLVVKYNPGSLDDRLALAKTAIKARNYEAATAALDGVKGAGKNTAAFHSVAGDLAACVNQPAVAEAHFREAARLEPPSLVARMNLEVLLLQGSNAPDSTEARSFLQTLASNPTNAELRGNALRQLTLDAMRHGETNTALDLSERLLQQTNSVFADNLLRLDVLRGALNAEFKPALAGVQRQVTNDPAKVAEMASWLATRTTVAEVLAWLPSLPGATQTNPAVAVVMAECYSDVHNWRGLQSFLEPQTWGEKDCIRHSFLARALRGQEMGDSAKIEWDKALRAARGSSQCLTMLMGLALQWGWVGEQEELLWTIVDQFPGDQSAFQALARTLYVGGRTRSLLQLYDQAAKRDPASVDDKNNVAFIALLLNAQEFKPHELAREVYNQSPTNSAFASTYALSLLLQKKNAEALKVIEKLDPGELKSPSIACLYGLALQATGNREKAREYLEIASKAPMLPEQLKLITGAGP
jgi:tetratricopeptide (TPR) repeat protein